MLIETDESVKLDTLRDALHASGHVLECEDFRANRYRLRRHASPTIPALCHVPECGAPTGVFIGGVPWCTQHHLEHMRALRVAGL
jgi:hypothetical protein